MKIKERSGVRVQGSEGSFIHSNDLRATHSSEAELNSIFKSEFWILNSFKVFENWALRLGAWGRARSDRSPRIERPTPTAKLLIFCCCLLLLLGCQPARVSPGITIEVQRIVSGHTLEVLNTGQQPPLIERVRLIGIEAPDLRQQPWGLAAKNHLEQMITDTTGLQSGLQSVFLEPDVQEKDSSGRWLAYVWYDGKLLNEELIKEGYVLAAPRSPNNKYDERFTRAQEYARIMGYGIWNPSQPMRLTPAEFRRQNP